MLVESVKDLATEYLLTKSERSWKGLIGGCLMLATKEIIERKGSDTLQKNMDDMDQAMELVKGMNNLG